MPYMPPPSLFAGYNPNQSPYGLPATSSAWPPVGQNNAAILNAVANASRVTGGTATPSFGNIGGGGGRTQTFRNVRVISNLPPPRPPLPPGTVPYAELANLTNQFMTGQAQAPFVANLPNYLDLVQQRSANIGTQLAGQVSPSTTNLLAQRGAERGIGVGAGGPNSAAAWLAALGLTSEGLQQQGQQNLSQAIADTPVPEIWNPMSLYVPEYLANLELAAARGGGGSNVPLGTIPGWSGSPAGDEGVTSFGRKLGQYTRTPWFERYKRTPFNWSAARAANSPSYRY